MVKAKKRKNKKERITFNEMMVNKLKQKQK